MDIEAGIFDIGGVLLDWKNDPLYDDVISHLQISREAFDSAWNKYIVDFGNGKVSEDEFWKNFLHEVKSDKTLPEESLFVRQFKKLYSPRKEMLDLVSKLRNDKYKLAVLSNTIEPHVRVMKENNLFEMFDVVIFSNEVGVSKPDREIYEITLDRLNVRAKNSFFVDDIKENVVAAQEMEIHGYVFNDFESFRKELDELGVTT